MYGDPSIKRYLGGLVGAIDITRFRSAEDFHHTISEMMRRWNAQPRAHEDEEVLYPGQPEEKTREKRLVEGIPVGVNLSALFSKISTELDVPWQPKI
jgi:ureidoglycolate dehydrogenase (NAD+)